MDVAVLLVNPKTPYNVGAAIRACSIYGVPTLRWTGNRIATAEGARYAGTTFKKNRPRLPREERLKDYTGVDWREADVAAGDRETASLTVEAFVREGLVPVAIEIVPGAESLDLFEHPERAVYVLGPEDGNVPRGVLSICHRFVRIPSVTRTPLNLAASLNVVLYDRYAKSLAAGERPRYRESALA